MGHLLSYDRNVGKDYVLRKGRKDPMERRTMEQKNQWLSLAKCLFASYLLTAALLLILALLLYKVGLTEKIVSVAIIAIYVVSTFLAGILAGKKMQNRKFLWGLLMGIVYFLILLIASLLVNHSVGMMGRDVLTSFILCSAGGMLGGMFA